MNVNILVETKDLSKAEWLSYRRMGIGGSDVAALLGISKWKSEMDLWLEKTGQMDGLVVENEATQWGNILEPNVIKLERRHPFRPNNCNIKQKTSYSMNYF